SPVCVDVPYPIPKRVQRSDYGKPNQRGVQEDEYDLEKITYKIHDDLNPDKPLRLYLRLIKPHDDVERLEQFPYCNDHDHSIGEWFRVHQHQNGGHKDEKRHRPTHFHNIYRPKNFIPALRHSGQLTDHDIVDAQVGQGCKNAYKAHRIIEHPVGFGLQIPRNINPCEEGNA